MKFLNLFSPLNSCKDLRFHFNFGDNNNERRFLYVKDYHRIGLKYIKDNFPSILIRKYVLSINIMGFLEIKI